MKRIPKSIPMSDDPDGPRIIFDRRTEDGKLVAYMPGCCMSAKGCLTLIAALAKAAQVIKRSNGNGKEEDE